MSQAPADPVAVPSAAAPKRSVMNRLRWPVIVLGPVIILAVAAYLWIGRSKTEGTDNAYVQIAKAPVSSTIPGRVVAVFVTENQRVKAGQPLFRLDARDFQVGEAEALARLAQAEVQIRSLRAIYEQRRTALGAVQENVDYTSREATRLKAMVAAGVASQQQADQAAHAAEQARQQLATAKQDVVAALANLGGDPKLPPERQPSVLAARAEVERVKLNASYTEVTAPTDGVVTRVEQLQPGAVVTPSQTVFWLLAGQPWVEANFKENQLAHMKVGQPATIKIDAYPGGPLKGHVASFSPGTGAVFSALPAQNATGNWVKVTQRLPVRIAFDKTPPEMAGRAGLSAKVEVDIEQASRADGH